MKRVMVLAVAVVAVAMLTAGTGTYYSGVTTMKFRRGTLPIVGYTGTHDTYISAKSGETDYNFGACDTLLLCGASCSDKGGQHSILICDTLAALPDSAVPVTIKYFMYQLHSGVTAITVSIFPLWDQWREGNKNGADSTGAGAYATWNKRMNWTAWHTAGALGRQTVPAYNTVSKRGGAGQYYQSAGGTAVGDTSATFPSMSGWDIEDTQVSYDIPARPMSVLWSKYAADIRNCRGWVSFEISPIAQRWIKGARKNVGVVLIADIDQWEEEGWASFASSEYKDTAYRPYWEVTFYDPDTITVVHDTLTVGTTVKYLGIGNGIGRQ